MTSRPTPIRVYTTRRIFSARQIVRSSTRSSNVIRPINTSVPPSCHSVTTLSWDALNSNPAPSASNNGPTTQRQILLIRLRRLALSASGKFRIALTMLRRLTRHDDPATMMYVNSTPRQ